jgi:transglutaminase-like putative cysteine protease
MTSRRLDLGCEFTYEAEVPTPAIFLVQVAADPSTISVEHWITTPDIERRDYFDLYGNRCVRVVLPAGWSSLRYVVEVEVPDATEDVDPQAQEMLPDLLPDDVLLFTLPSRYCLPDVLGDEAWARFGSMPTGYSRVAAICDYVHTYLSFEYGSTTAWSTAADVNMTGLGVCRDFAHLAISFCRALNIPARYAFGYLPYIEVVGESDVMDFAAWIEVWLDGRWWTFDPRNNAPRKGRVVIGRGRDAADVAMATTFGGPRLHEMTVTAQELAP